MKELRIFGPPGTGKSSRLATEEIPNAVKKFGTDKVVVTSFTRAGAKEIAYKRSVLTGQRIPVDPNHVGTLHALCYRQLSQPALVDTDHVARWNENYPKYVLSPQSFIKKIDEGITEKNGDSENSGDDYLNALDIYRAKMIDRRYWDPKVQKFEKLWTDFKKQTGTMDFTDLIETAINELPYAPGRPDVIFVDEAQDFTRLQLNLVRRWGEESQWIVLVGDDDQTIYGFAGATPDAFLNPPIDQKHKRVLNQSYRVPLSVLQLSQKMIRQVSAREEKDYKPRKAEGEFVQGVVREMIEGYNRPDKIFYDISRQLQSGKTVMVLASCAYMIDPIRRELKKRAMAFWNPYRTERGDWNPLKSSDSANTSKDIIVNFLSKGEDGDFWDIEQFVSWAQNLKVQEGGLIHKTGKLGIKALKKAIQNGDEGLHSARNVISQILTPCAVQKALSRDLNWLYGNLLKNRQSGVEFPIRVYRQSGLSALTEKPKITIGTIHSVKGGEADCVYLYPDISFATKRQLENHRTSRQTKDGLYRLFYVGMTRAREELVLMKYSIQKGRVYFVKLYGNG